MLPQIQDRVKKMADKKYGFLGVGIMGNGMVRCLLAGGLDVTVWNRTAAKCSPYVEIGAEALPPLPVQMPIRDYVRPLLAR